MAKAPALIAYDGSDGARRALEAAVRMGVERCVVVHVVRDDVSAAAVPIGVGAPLPMETVVREVRSRNRSEALGIAEEGVRRCRAAGAEAEARVHELDPGGDVAHAIVAEADEIDAGLIALGHRGHGPIHAALLGSVSKAVLQCTDRPVLLVR